MDKNQIKETAKLLAMMFNSFPQSGMADVDAQMEAYLFSVEEFEFIDVSNAIRRIMQGGEGHERRSFSPSTAELCQEVRRREEIRKICKAKGMREMGQTGKLVAIEGGR